ncbi:MAG: hypothetical protein A2Y84_01085 [Candidatus Colwellbacteria bacterium RBG_13_48_8]|uniref:DUF1653 domain-containing protein n=1 Tax=Candidatus Colwellbacteria bacterium RBG_13_48_8 TaxID=1797685 RepID=A0A1G1YYN3_9BACT|nr:MAG: hypothetical protein A2Y84_01085 [Candidatus Colwellbacteria bacterium RBG_13_48_8]
MADSQIKLGEYEHFKGKRYRVVGVARHSETLEEMVVYQALYGAGDLWVRPLKMFTEEVEVNRRKVPRFKYIGE